MITLIPSSPRDSPVSLNQQSLKQRVNMVVMRMIAQNSDQDHRAPREEVGGRGEGGRLPGGPYQPPHLQGGPGESREVVKQRVVGVTRVVVSPRESMGLVEELLRAGQVGGGVILTGSVNIISAVMYTVKTIIVTVAVGIYIVMINDINVIVTISISIVIVHSGFA